MPWQENEDFVLEQVKQRLDAARLSDPAGFHRMFAEAYEPLRNLRVNNAYDLPLTGEAYWLKYGLQRMDNMSVALSRTGRVHPLLQEARNLVLDVGGGSGASSMGLMRNLAGSVNLSQRNVKIVLAEPSEPMRSMARGIIPAFQEKLGLSTGFELTTRDLNLQACAERCARAAQPALDLAIFCYTFWIQERDEWAQTTQHVLQIAQAVKPGGVLLFLTPNVTNRNDILFEKVLFMRHLKEQLNQAGFNSLNVLSDPQGFRPGQSTCVERRSDYDAKWPKPVCDYLAELLQIPELRGDDRPYYAFTAIIDAFTR